MEKKSAPQTVSRSASNPVSTAKPNTPPAAALDAALSLRPDAGSDTEQRFIDIETVSYTHLTLPTNSRV